MPDGNLHLLPFDSFITEHAQSLVETHIVSYAPSATSFYLLRTLPTASQPGNPCLPWAGFLYIESQAPKQYATRSLFTLEAKKIDYLTQTAAEIRAISQLFPDGAVVLEGKGATEAALKSQPLEGFRILHFALHGFSDTSIPERTALVLAADNDSPEDGLLHDREIRDLRLSADLVTLSACELVSGGFKGRRGFPAWFPPSSSPVPDLSWLAFGKRTIDQPAL